MTTYEDLIEDTRHHLMTSQPDRLNVLDSTIDTDDSVVVLRHANKGVAEGSTLVIGLEEMHVVLVTASGALTNVTVIRGHNNSTPAAHTAGDTIYVNPQFSTYWIGKKVNTALDALSGEGLFTIKTATFTSGTIPLGYELTGLNDFISVWRVRHNTVGPSNHWPVLRPDEYWVDMAADTTDFPSGRALFLQQGVSPNQAVRVSYRAGFTHLVNLSDDVTTVALLHDEAHDLPGMYAAICLLAGREIKRSFLHNQPEPRRAEEVPPGAANQAMRPLVEMFYGRVDQEKARLKRMYPGAI